MKLEEGFRFYIQKIGSPAPQGRDLQHVVFSDLSA